MPNTIQKSKKESDFIHLEKEFEEVYWSKRFNISKESLIEACHAIQDNMYPVEKVCKELLNSPMKYHFGAHSEEFIKRHMQGHVSSLNTTWERNYWTHLLDIYDPAILDHARVNLSGDPDAMHYSEDIARDLLLNHEGYHLTTRTKNHIIRYLNGMTDDKQRRRKESDYIHLDLPYEMTYWSNHFGITTAALKEACGAVANDNILQARLVATELLRSPMKYHYNANARRSIEEHLGRHLSGLNTDWEIEYWSKTLHVNDPYVMARVRDNLGIDHDGKHYSETIAKDLLYNARNYSLTEDVKKHLISYLEGHLGYKR